MQNIVSPYIEDMLQKIVQKQNSNNFSLNSIFQKVIDKIVTFFNLPSNKQLQNVDWSNFESVLSIIGTTLVIFLILGIAMYLLKSIGLYQIMKKENIPNAWISFIPFGFTYAIGKIIGKTKLYNIEIENPEYVLPIIILVNSSQFMCGISSIIYVLTFWGLIYRLYQKKVPTFAITLTILSILLPPLIPLYIFAIRKK